jgi:hypothetical protein
VRILLIFFISFVSQVLSKHHDQTAQLYVRHFLLLPEATENEHADIYKYFGTKIGGQLVLYLTWVMICYFSFPNGGDGFILSG